jgi:hypothetical protein
VEARDGGERGGDGGRAEAAEGGARAKGGVEAAALEERHQELRHEAARRWGRGGGHGFRFWTSFSGISLDTLAVAGVLMTRENSDVAVGFLPFLLFRKWAMSP